MNKQVRYKCTLTDTSLLTIPHTNGLQIPNLQAICKPITIYISDKDKILADGRQNQKLLGELEKASGVPYTYSKFNVPKYSGQWKFGLCNPIGFHERKWGVCNLSPHL